MAIGFTSIGQFGLARTAELLTRAFTDYFVKIAFTEAVLRHAEESDGVNFAESPVVLLDGVPAGAALIARRGAESRLAGMAILPTARRQGVGRVLMERLLADARARGDRRMVLEVIAQNAAAVRLYEAMGFQRKRRLLGFAGPAPAGLRPVAELAEVGVSDVAAAIRRQPVVDWPWQISGATIAQLPAPAAGYALDCAWTVVPNPSGPVAGFRTLVVEGAERREERAVRLLHAVMARHPTVTEWRMSALLPEEFGAWFTAAGLAQTELYQWQMERAL
jgi:ribosomal protein S18 acetylase RimI-like enzyme